MDADDREYIQLKHCPPAKLERIDEPLFCQYFSITMQGLLQNSKKIDQIGWRQLTIDAGNLAHEMVSQHKAKFK